MKEKAMDYEHALRFVFKCGRFGVDSLADADVFRGAETDDKWKDVANGLKKALKKINEESLKLKWTAKDMDYGGGAINFRLSLEDAIKSLNEGDDKPTSYTIIAHLIVCLSAALRSK